MAATICQIIFALILFLILIEVCTGFGVTRHLLRKMADRKGEAPYTPEQDEEGSGPE